MADPFLRWMARPVSTPMVQALIRFEREWRASHFCQGRVMKEFDSLATDGPIPFLRSYLAIERIFCGQRCRDPPAMPGNALALVWLKGVVAPGFETGATP